MRVLLRNTKTGQYLQQADKWTQNRRDAARFENTRQALSVVLKERLFDMEILLGREGIPYDVRLPIDLPQILASALAQWDEQLVWPATPVGCKQQQARVGDANSVSRGKGFSGKLRKLLRSKVRFGPTRLRIPRRVAGQLFRPWLAHRY